MFVGVGVVELLMMLVWVFAYYELVCGCSWCCIWFAAWLFSFDVSIVLVGTVVWVGYVYLFCLCLLQYIGVSAVLSCLIACGLGYMA